MCRRNKRLLYNECPDTGSLINSQEDKINLKENSFRYKLFKKSGKTLDGSAIVIQCLESNKISI